MSWRHINSDKEREVEAYTFAPLALHICHGAKIFYSLLFNILFYSIFMRKHIFVYSNIYFNNNISNLSQSKLRALFCDFGTADIFVRFMRGREKKLLVHLLFFVLLLGLLSFILVYMVGSRCHLFCGMVWGHRPDELSRVSCVARCRTLRNEWRASPPTCPCDWIHTPKDGPEKKTASVLWFFFIHRTDHGIRRMAVWETKRKKKSQPSSSSVCEDVPRP